MIPIRRRADLTKAAAIAAAFFLGESNVQKTETTPSAEAAGSDAEHENLAAAGQNEVGQGALALRL